MLKISSFYACVPKLTIICYDVWFLRCGVRQTEFLFWTVFLPFYVYHKRQSYDIWFFQIWSAADKIFLSFWTVFCPFTSLTTLKMENFEKPKKTPGDIILHKYTKNYDHKLYCSLDMAHNRCNYFSFWAIFYAFTPPHPEK